MEERFGRTRVTRATSRNTSNQILHIGEQAQHLETGIQECSAKNDLFLSFLVENNIKYPMALFQQGRGIMPQGAAKHCMFIYLNRRGLNINCNWLVEHYAGIDSESQIFDHRIYRTLFVRNWLFNWKSDPALFSVENYADYPSKPPKNR